MIGFSYNVLFCFRLTMSNLNISDHAGDSASHCEPDICSGKQNSSNDETVIEDDRGELESDLLITADFEPNEIVGDSEMFKQNIDESVIVIKDNANGEIVMDDSNKSYNNKEESNEFRKAEIAKKANDQYVEAGNNVHVEDDVEVVSHRSCCSKYNWKHAFPIYCSCNR